MATTRLALQNQIYEILGKSSTSYGYLTPTKVQAAIQDSLDYIATKMIRVGTGWLMQRAYIDIVANVPTVALPAGCAVINFVKKKVNATEYEAITFDENSTGQSSTVSAGGVSGVPAYHLVNGAIYLEPTPDTSITNGILIEYVSYPAVLTSDASTLISELDLAGFVQYAKWRAAKMLYSLANQNPMQAPPWAQYEAEWLMECQTIIAKRVRMPAMRLPFSQY